MTIAFGASLFDDRYGLRAQARRADARCPPSPTTTSTRRAAHGDVLLQICADQRDTVVHALRELLRPVARRARAALDDRRLPGADRGPTPRSSRRNLFGFRDGTANPDVHDDALMDRLVWTPPTDAGGTFQVVRVIRMHVEFWDRVGLREQET